MAVIPIIVPMYGGGSSLPLSPENVLFLKVTFVLAIIGMIVGIIKSVKDNNDWPEHIWVGLFGLFAVPAFMMILGGIYLGFKWVIFG